LRSNCYDKTTANVVEIKTIYTKDIDVDSLEVVGSSVETLNTEVTKLIEAEAAARAGSVKIEKDHEE
jgi:uncharacterized protein YfcZ (UPF0381/DUF406 family)